MRVADNFQHAPNYYGENQPNFVNNFTSNCSPVCLQSRLVVLNITVSYIVMAISSVNRTTSTHCSKTPSLINSATNVSISPENCHLVAEGLKLLRGRVGDL